MNWLIILPEKTKSDGGVFDAVAVYESLLKRHNADYFFFQENKESVLDIRHFVEQAAKATHCIIAKKYQSEKDLEEDFIAGYLCGREIPVFANISFSEKCEISSCFKYFHSEHEILVEIDSRYDMYLKDERKQNALRALFTAGIPFTADSFSLYVATNKRRECQLFVDAGMDVNSCDSEGTPMLNIAARYEQIECVEWLLDHGADINGISKDRGYSAVMDAVWKDNEEITDFLILQNANLNFISRDGQPILVLAVGIGNEKICEMLATHGANPDLADSMGMSAYGYAKLFRKTRILSILEKYHKK